MMVDAASPEQFDALAFQFLCVARRIKRVSGPEYAKAWKTASTAAASAAAAARIRLAANPSRESHPGFFNHRSVGKPGHLACVLLRSEKRCVGKECVRTCRSRGWPCH